MEGAFPPVGVVLSLRKKRGLFDHIDVWHKIFLPVGIGSLRLNDFRSFVFAASSFYNPYQVPILSSCVVPFCRSKATAIRQTTDQARYDYHLELLSNGARGCRTMENDKRRCARLRTSLRVECKFKDQTAPIQTRAIEISARGTSLSLPEGLPKGKEAELEIYLPSGRKISVNGEVVWTQSKAAGKGTIHEIGIRFTQIDIRCG